MYSRQSDRGIRVPPNYSGNIFRDSAVQPTPVEDHTRRRQNTLEQNDTPRYIEEISEEGRNDIENAVYDDEQKNHEESEHKEKKAPILSPFGELGTEELLLIALALIVFGSGKEPDLALILLALLFIN